MGFAAQGRVAYYGHHLLDLLLIILRHRGVDLEGNLLALRQQSLDFDLRSSRRRISSLCVLPTAEPAMMRNSTRVRNC